MSTALIVVAGLAIAYGIAASALYLLQRRILFVPDRTAPDLERVAEPRPRPVTVATDDGLALRAWYQPPAHADGYVVLYLHGNAGNIGHRAFRLPHFAHHGWGVLLLEYRGYGGNAGSPSEHGLRADARSGLASLLGMGFGLERIVVWGESLGSGLAVRLGTEAAVAAILLEAPFTSITDIARARFPWVPVRRLLRDHFDSLGAIAAIRAPLLVMHGERDTIVPVAMGRSLFSAAPGPKEIWVVPDAGHLDLVDAGAIAQAAEFVRRLPLSR